MSPLISHGGHTESHSIFATYVRNDLMCPSRHRDTKSSLAKVTRNTVMQNYHFPHSGFPSLCHEVLEKSETKKVGNTRQSWISCF